ncbi:hypothetical protein BGX26_009616, partial [Mortierella sp. AD094]
MRLMNRVSSTLGVQLPMSLLFSTPVLTDFSEIISDKISQGDLPHLAITPASREGPLELSLAQKSLWFLAHVEGVSETYHIRRALRLRGVLDHIAMDETMNALFARHEAL